MKTVKLVIKENGKNGGKGFDFFMEGDTEGLKTKTEEDDLSPAEFWGSKLFAICVDILKKVGVTN